MEVKAVILDWAGTTVDYGSRAPASVFVEVFRRSGVDITEAEAREPMGMSKRDHIATICNMPRVGQLWLDQHGSPPTDGDVQKMYDEFLPLQKETLQSHSDVIPGVPEAIEALRSRGVKIGSNTGYTRELMDVVVPLAAAGGYSPDAVVCSDDVSSGRPAPWMNFRVAEQLGVYPMSAIVVVDDTPVGVAAGKNSGCLSVGITRTGNTLGLSEDEVNALPPEEVEKRIAQGEAAFREAGADHVLRSVADLPALLF